MQNTKNTRTTTEDIIKTQQYTKKLEEYKELQKTQNQTKQYQRVQK